MKILHLIISFSSTEYYKDMKVSLSNFYVPIVFVDTFFVEYDPDLDIPFKILNSTIFIKGSESLIPGLLLKTLDAIKIKFFDSYDYVVRSNLSTVIDFYRLREVLECNNNINYLGGQILNNTSELQAANGRNDPNLEDVKFAAGTMICLSKILITKIINFENKFNYDLIDDLSIGVLIEKFFPEVTISSLKLSLFVVNAWGSNDSRDIEKLISEIRPVVYRNKTEDRVIDSKKLRIISEKLTNYYLHDLQIKVISREGPIHLHLLR